MAILSVLFIGMYGKVFSLWWAALAAVLALAGYTLLAGAGGSVVRATIMCALELRPDRLVVLLPGLVPAEGFPPEAFQAGELVLVGGQAPAPWRAKGLRVLAPPPGGWLELELQSDGERLWIEEGR